jgi:MFS family permease
MPTFAESIGLSSSTGAGLVAAFNAASAVGRISSGFLSDKIGSVNVALMSMSLLGTTMFLIWPFASTLGVLIVFVIVAGVAVGGFFSMMPTVVGHIFGSANMSVTMGMILTSWTFGYLLVRRVLSPLPTRELRFLLLTEYTGVSHRRLHLGSQRRSKPWHCSLQARDVLCRFSRAGFGDSDCDCEIAQTKGASRQVLMHAV